VDRAKISVILSIVGGIFLSVPFVMALCKTYDIAGWLINALILSGLALIVIAFSLMVVRDCPWRRA